MSINRVIKEIREHSRFLITSHVNAEGDAIGSQLALAALLIKLGKKVRVVNSEKAPANYIFLPGAKTISDKIGGFDFQVVFIVDCPVMKRIGALAEVLADSRRIVTIDHHIDNQRFGHVNWIDPRASSVGEMIYALFKSMRLALDKKVALNIYAAILTDTGSFRHTNTTSGVLQIASALLEFGISPADIYTRIYENNTIQDIRAIVQAISKLNFADQGRIAWLEVKKDLCRRIEGKTELVDKILDFGKSVRSVKVVVILYQLEGRTLKASFRSKAPVDVQQVAKLFGGGGHRCASGCKIKGSFSRIREEILRELKKAIRRARR